MDLQEVVAHHLGVALAKLVVAIDLTRYTHRSVGDTLYLGRHTIVDKYVAL